MAPKAIVIQIRQHAVKRQQSTALMVLIILPRDSFQDTLLSTRHSPMGATSDAILYLGLRSCQRLPLHCRILKTPHAKQKEH